MDINDAYSSNAGIRIFTQFNIPNFSFFFCRIRPLSADAGSRPCDPASLTCVRINNLHVLCRLKRFVTKCPLSIVLYQTASGNIERKEIAKDSKSGTFGDILTLHVIVIKTSIRTIFVLIIYKYLSPSFLLYILHKLPIFGSFTKAKMSGNIFSCD